MTHRLRPLLIVLALLAASLPAGSPLAPAPVVAATGDPGCVTEIVILQSGEAATRLNCEGNDDLTPVVDPPSTTTLYPPYCATGTRAFVTPRSYDKLGRVIAKDANGKIAAGGYGWEPTSVASPLVRSAVFNQTRDQLAAAYTKAKRSEGPVLPNSFLWRSLAPDIVAALLQIEALPSSIGGGGGALVQRDLTTRLTELLTLTSTSKASPYFADGSYFQPDEFGKTDSFSVTNGATILPEGLAAVGGAVWTLPVGEGATDLQLLPRTRLTHTSIPGMPSSWSAFLQTRVNNFWSSGGELATFKVAGTRLTLRDLLSYTWTDSGYQAGTPFTSTAPVRAATAKSFITAGGVFGGRYSVTPLPVKMMYHVERYVPVNRVVAWQKYQRVWVPPTTQKVCTTVKGKKTCKMVTTPGYYKWPATNTYVGNRLSKWIAKDYPQPASTLTTRWEPISALVGYKIEMGPDTWAVSEKAYNDGIKGSSGSLSGLLAKQQRDADSSSGQLLRKLEGDWWSVGVIPGLKNAGGTTLASVSTLLNQAVMRQLGTDTNRDSRITGAEGMTYGQNARWYFGNGTEFTPGYRSTLMLPAFRAPSEILSGAAQSASPSNAGTKAIEICGNPIKKLDFAGQVGAGGVGSMKIRPLSLALVPGGVEMQRMGMVLFENNCRTNNIARATDYERLRGAPTIDADDTVGAACWTGWGLYRVPLPFISASSDISAIFNYYKVKRTGVCPDGTTTCNRWTTPVLDTPALVGTPYAIVGDTPLPPAYLNVVSTKSGFGGAPAAISASQIGVTLEIGRVCRVAAGTDLVRYCSNITDVAGRLIARVNRAANGYPVSVVFDRTPLSRLGDPDCRSLSRAALLTECGIGYDEKSGNYFFRVRVRTWWNGVISHRLPDWPKPLGLFSNLTFSGDEDTNSASFDYLRSWGSPANLGLSDRYQSSLTFAQENPPTGSPWVNGNGAPASPPTPPPAGWGAYWLCSSYSRGAQAAACPVSSTSPEYRRRARPLFDASMACNPDGSLTALLNDLRESGAVSTAAQRADCFLDIPVVSSQPGAN